MTGRLLAYLIWLLLFSLCSQLQSSRVVAQQGELQQNAGEQRTDSFETKLKLLEEAWQRKDYDLARSLTHTLRDTVIQTQTELQPPLPSLVATKDYSEVGSLPDPERKWAKGWKFFKTFSVEETAGETRASEPVEIAVSFPSEHVTSLAREIRLARVEVNQIVEVPCQVFGEVRRGTARSCRLLWLADCKPMERQTYLIFFGNPDAELPQYPSDLTVVGEGVGLDISNAFFKASLSIQNGQLERLTLRREHGLELFSGGEGHGEPPGIDWAHDYVDTGNFQKLRITLWDQCPDYEVIRGPLCTIVRRWGFPRSPVHPVFTPSRLKVDVEYRFYSGLPWFHKIGSMQAIQDFRAEALRDDEWVFSGQSFTDMLWMDHDGKLHPGAVDSANQEDLWGVGFYNAESKDSFVALFLEHSSQGIPELKHTGAPTMYYRWHGSVWSRYPLPVKDVPAGAVLRQKNAYVSIPFDATNGPTEIERLRRCMMGPLTASAQGSVDRDAIANLKMPESTIQLARPGEAGDSELKRLVWQGLQDCKDGQLYMSDISVVELGLVRDVHVRGNVVTVVMTMPHRGRPRLGYFVDGSTSVHPTLSVPIRERLMQIPGVRQVVVEQTWEPAWSSNDLTDVGRKKLGVDVEP